MPRYDSIEEQLLSGRSIDEETGCWRWTKLHSEQGYGKVNICGRQWFVHRAAYDLWVDEILEDHGICHTIDDGICYPDCFNPAHLEMLPNVEISERGMAQRKLRASPAPGCRPAPQNSPSGPGEPQDASRQASATPGPR